MRRVSKIRAKDIHAGMSIMEGIKGRRICEVHTNKTEVLIVYKGADGKFVHKKFGPMHKVKVRH